MKYQKLYNLIFSEDRSQRWKRHFLFCLAVFLYHVARIGLMYPLEKIPQNIFSLLEMALFVGVVINVVFSYAVVYFLIPKYFNTKKYVRFAIGLLLLEIIVQSMMFFHNVMQINLASSKAIGLTQGMSFSALRAGFIRLFGNGPLICGFLLSLKTLKNWHLEQLKSETLARENVNAELQLLKAQIHPHFLFNTLNNIYSFTLNQSPEAGALVQKLSSMLRYMIHECEQSLVPLEKEVELIQDYISLEKIRYGSRLSMGVDS